MDMILQSWNELTKPFIDSDKGVELRKFISERRKEINVYPSTENVMRVFKDETIKPTSVRVVILGQDPYHNGTADGIAFSTTSQKRPESLKNIIKELHSNLYSYMKEETWNTFMPTNRLDNWVKQGILLMNTVLTVEEGSPNSHQNLGWEYFTHSVIERLGGKSERPRVFMLWGNNAKALKPLITGNQHLILEAAHPSPFSADKGFFGCNHFTKTHEFMKESSMDGENHTLTIDMRKYVDFDGIINYIKQSVINNQIPLPTPGEKLNEVARILRDDYFWDSQYGVNYSTKI